MNYNPPFWVHKFGYNDCPPPFLGLRGEQISEFIEGDLVPSVKISNQNFSEKINDGLKLNSTYITNILKCVPPGDKPMNDELSMCSNYFIKEHLNIVVNNITISQSND